METTPTHAQLGAALQAAVGSSQKLAAENNWRAAPGSATAAYWREGARQEDPLQLTLAEADVQAVLLIRSALVHAAEAGRAISKMRPFLPHTLGRVAVEHALRALSLTDVDAEPMERAERRLDDLLYAISEAERRSSGFAKKAKLADGEFATMDDALAQVEERASALGFTVFRTKTGGRRVSEGGRPSPMALAEKYMAGDSPGVLEFLIRGHGAYIHGNENVLLSTATDHFDPETGINVPAATTDAASTLALALMGLPLALDNGFRAVAARFEWPAAGKAYREFDRDRTRLLDTWMVAVDHAPEADPELVGLFGSAAHD